ncbi:uncharacterized protein LOC131694578 [Topomyia yanbarensis]|uniref:uncharacterized protein LOC131694578 n=1 Tax=Topomyia yanbarensis TaxID=2498891 RepID=UPI00273A934C|nr:uncharacterized protein LOC131694578 [Topomyia yanbarensis]
MIPGHVDELKEHFRLVHNLNTSKAAAQPFLCSECGSLYQRFKSLKRHIESVHPLITENSTNISYDHDAVEQIQNNHPENMLVDDDYLLRITNTIFFKTAPSLDEITKKISKFATDLRKDVSLPETKIKKFLQVTSNLIEDYECYMLNLFREFLKSKSIPLNDTDALKFINDASLDGIFADVASPKDNLAYLSGVAGCAVPNPREQVLGRTRITKTVPAITKLGKRKSVQIVKDIAHYIPLTSILALVMKNPGARKMIAEEAVNDDILCGFKDGQRFKTHPFLTRFPDALRLSLHLDDVEYLNPLGSRKSKKKLTNFSVKIENLHPAINSSSNRIYLTLTVRSRDVKKYGYNNVMKPLIQDLRELESDDGVVVQYGSEKFTMRAVLVHVLGDTLAIHEIFELMGPQSSLFCRMCYATRTALHCGNIGDTFPHRTEESIQGDLNALQSGTKTPSQCGIIRKSALNEVKYFNIAENNTFDPMHDLLEGVVMVVIKCVLNEAVNIHKVITISQVNQIIQHYEYGITESADKPTANFTCEKLKARGHAIPQSASQCWLLLRAFPFMFNQILGFNSNLSSVLRALMKITYYSFSNKLTLNQNNDLENEIECFYKLFKSCFPAINPTNKFHHISHYPYIIRQDGPVVNHSCLRFEAKFKESKSQAKTCNNFINLTNSFAKRLNLAQITNHYS